MRCGCLSLPALRTGLSSENPRLLPGGPSQGKAPPRPWRWPSCQRVEGQAGGRACRVTQQGPPFPSQRAGTSPGQASPVQPPSWVQFPLEGLGRQGVGLAGVATPVSLHQEHGHIIGSTKMCSVTGAPVGGTKLTDSFDGSPVPPGPAPSLPTSLPLLGETVHPCPLSLQTGGPCEGV